MINLAVNNSMKTHHMIECPCLEQIQREALNWIKQETDLLTSADEFWNKIDYKHFIMLNPTLALYCTKTLKLIIREVAVLVAHSPAGVPLHTDEPPVIAKMNFPILNTKDTYTEWWDNEQLIDRVECTQPMVFNSSIPHKVCIGSTAVLPRVSISCMFYKEPIELLQADLPSFAEAQE
jgi:hypothetical protein